MKIRERFARWCRGTPPPFDGFYLNPPNVRPWTCEVADRLRAFWHEHWKQMLTWALAIVLAATGWYLK